ncbi:hypothetical protein [Flagellimonas okinawensis]|uniref:Uncharacterized protein n=1 Tax=Flagellimonas okinawensis TaxID=3031324 RepID=A0ABT5XT00_9FLAO|nr:hypothetical protein [[Muricauda] okinawensis]MDF0709028.1 hypothetical protein [[Muricauda] okinawensis]
METHRMGTIEIAIEKELLYGRWNIPVKGPLGTKAWSVAKSYDMVHSVFCPISKEYLHGPITVQKWCPGSTPTVFFYEIYPERS